MTRKKCKRCAGSKRVIVLPDHLKDCLLDDETIRKYIIECPECKGTGER